MKSILRSKTFWLAIVQAFVGIIAIFATQYPSVGALVIAKSCADIFLRLITTTAITTSSNAQTQG